MKLLNISKYLLATTLLVATTTSCGTFLDVNNNPNGPTTVPPNTLLTSSIYGMAFANNNEVNRLTEVLVNHLTGQAGSPLTYDSYGISGLDNQWDFELYGGALVAAQNMIEGADAVKSPAYSGIGKIVKAYCFAMTTDLWGDVPYSDALKGIQSVTQPRIDKQEDIYKGNASLKIQSIFDLVKEGLADLDKPSAILPGAADDPVYAGNLANWKRAGNTLIMKLALQISSKEPALAKTLIQDVISGGNFISDNSQDLSVAFGSSVGSVTASYNYTSNTFGNLFRNDMVMSRKISDVMKAQNDPRLPFFFTKPGADYVSGVNGFGNAPAPATNWSRYGTYVTGGDGKGPVRLITNSQRAFIMAEAVVRLGIVGDAQALYQEGIRASMLSAGVTAAGVTAFFAANPTVATLAGTDAAKIEQIITQKWISLVGNGYESYNDYRRTGFPVLDQVPNPVSIDNKFPRRIPYTNNEISRNPNLVPKGSVPPQTNVRVWWDVN